MLSDEFFSTLRSPVTGAALRVDGENLRSADGSETWPIVGGIPRFVRDEHLESFGLQWNRYEVAWAGRLKSAGFAVWATRHMFRWGLLFPALEWNGSRAQARAAKELAQTEEYAWVAGIAARAADARAGISFGSIVSKCIRRAMTSHSHGTGRSS